MPSTEIELDDRNKPAERIVNFGHRKEGFGVSHEAVIIAPGQYSISPGIPLFLLYPTEVVNVLCDPLQHRPWL